MKHSKGQWGSQAALSSDFGNIRYITVDNENSKEIPTIAEIRHNRNQSLEEAIANANLITAAPDLLEVVLKIKEDIDNNKINANSGIVKDSYIWHKLNSAIAKATN